MVIVKYIFCISLGQCWIFLSKFYFQSSFASELRHCCCTMAQPRPRRPPIGCHLPPFCRQSPLIGSGSGSERLCLSSGVSSGAPCRSRGVFFSQSAFGRWAVTRVSSVSASGVSSQFVSALEARDRGWGWSLWGQRRDFGVSIPRSDKSKRFLLWDYKKGGERLGNDFWLFPNVQLFHYFRMTDNGVEMVGGESNNQGQVRDKVLFGAIKPLL